MGQDYETGLDRKDRYLLNLLTMIRYEEDAEKRAQYQKIIDDLTKPKEI